MDKGIKLFYGDNRTGTLVVLNKLEITKKILELLETKEVESIEINYKRSKI